MTSVALTACVQERSLPSSAEFRKELYLSNFFTLNFSSLILTTVSFVRTFVFVHLFCKFLFSYFYSPFVQITLDSHGERGFVWRRDPLRGVKHVFEVCE